MDWEAMGLLDGLEGREREARRALLDELHAEGIAPEELQRAVAEDRLVLLPLERALLAPPRYTAAEAAARAGLDVENLRMLERGAGLPVREDDAVAYGDDDVAALRRFGMYLGSGIRQEDILGLLRTLSSAMARSAEAARAIFARAYLQAGDTEHELGGRYREMTEILVPSTVMDLEFLLRLHLREFARHDAVATGDRAAGSLPDSVPVAVAFADLVGFTALGEELDEVALGAVADRFFEIAHARVTGSVRIVKTIGDAVMLVAPAPAPLVDVLLDLLAAVEADADLPPLRAGSAWGPALARHGDWYGATVNLAARLAARARPGAVLVTQALRDELPPDRYALSRAGDKRLRGFSDPVRTWRVRSTPDASAP